jgi:hypothetical protein
MQPGSMNLVLYRGDSYKWQFTLWTDEAKTVPADLTGATPKAEIRVGPGTTVLATLITSVTMPNKINVTLTSTVCASLPPTAKWDLQVTYTGSPPDVITIVAGNVTVTADITDSTGALLTAAAAEPRTTIRRVQ